MNRFSKFLLGLAAVAGLYSCSDGSANVYMPVRLNESEMWSIINVKNGEVVALDAFSKAPSFVGHDDIFYVETSDGLYEYYSVSDINNPISSERFSQVNGFYADVTTAVKPGETVSLINTSLETVKQLPASVESVYDFGSGMAAFEDKEGKFGFLNQKGEVAIEAKYVKVSGFVGDYAFVAESGTSDNFYIIDKTGKAVTKMAADRYDWVYLPISEGYFGASVKGKVSLYNVKNEKVLSNNMMEHNSLNPDLYIVRGGKFIFFNDGMYGLMDIEGKVLIRPKYKMLQYCGKDRYVAERNNQYGVVNGSDEVIIPFEYEAIYALGANRYLVSEVNNNFYLVDESLKELLPMEISDFQLETTGRVDSEYADVAEMVDKLAAEITPASVFGADRSTTAAQIASMLGLTNPADYRWSHDIDREFVASGITARVVYSFGNATVGSDYDFSQSTYVDRFSTAPVENVTVYVTESPMESVAIQRQLASRLKTSGFRMDGENYVSDNGLTVSLENRDGFFAVCCQF